MNYNVIINTCTEHPFFCIIFVTTVLFFACVFFRGWPISSSSEESYGDSEDDYEDDEDNCDGDCDDCDCKSQLSIEGKYNFTIKEETHPASPAKIRNLELTITREKND